MDDKSLTREQRLAAKLRENLRRRKAQAREMDEMPRRTPPDASPGARALPNGETKS